MNAPDTAETSYLRELAADIAAHGGLQGKAMAEAVAAAHRRRQSFIAEMAQEETKRARMARAALTASIWAEIHAKAAPERAVTCCAWIDSRGGQ